MFGVVSTTEYDRRVAAFYVADFGNKNYFIFREFQNALKALGFTFLKDETRVIFHKADENEDGIIDIEEFFKSYESLEEE
jgi:Ca2+-binding EF-hand superfamily protein